MPVGINVLLSWLIYSYYCFIKKALNLNICFFKKAIMENLLLEFKEKITRTSTKLQRNLITVSGQRKFL
jgi:hypothetical protein